MTRPMKSALSTLCSWVGVRLSGQGNPGDLDIVRGGGIWRMELGYRGIEAERRDPRFCGRKRGRSMNYKHLLFER